MRSFREGRPGRGRWHLLLGVLLLGAGCNGGGTMGPDGPPVPVPGEPRELETAVVSTGDRHPPQRDRIEWSADDRWLLYASGPGSDIWRIAADGGTHPAAITDPATSDWLDADYSPCALAGDRVAFFHGWYLGDRHLHLLATPVHDDDGRLVSVLHRFAPSGVGLAPDQVSSPQTLTVAADGRRAVGFWHEAYLLVWPDSLPDSAPAIHLLENVDGPRGLALTRDGSRLAYVTPAGQVAYADPADLSAPRLVGEGILPSWNGDGTRLAFLSPQSEVMLLDTVANTLVSYRTQLPGPVTQLALSWHGEQVALLVRGPTSYELFVGSLATGTDP